MTRLPVTAIEPIGTRKVYAHVNHPDPDKHGFQWVDMPEYPTGNEEAARRLRALRVELGMSLGEAARALGIGVAEMSGLERAEGFTCDYEQAMAMLKGAG